MKTQKTGGPSLLTALMALLIAFSVSMMPSLASAAEWTVDGNIVTYTDQVGWSPDGTAYSGTVSLHMESAVISGQVKIITTILDIEPAPGFGYAVKKSGGVNGVVEIEFTSAPCQSKFSFLYKPGLTKIDSGVMRCQ